MGTIISHKTPTPYWNRHPDWYKGTFKDLCHAYGLQGELVYYMSMEKECQEITAWFMWDALGILQWLKKWLIDAKTNTYNKNYTTIYDESALGGCKFAENFEAKLNDAFNGIKDAYNNAVAQAKQMVTKVSDYINDDLAPIVNKATQNAQAAIDKINGEVNTAINTALSNANKAKQTVEQTISQVNNVISTVNSQSQQITDLKGKAEQTIKDLTNASKIIKTHSEQIEELYQKIKEKPSSGTTNPSTNPVQTLAEKLGIKTALF